MSFDVAADAYGRFMGRFSEPLAAKFAAFAGVADGYRVLDVGCGPGALTRHLVGFLGPDQVSAVDPSELFVTAARQRCPGVDIRTAGAENLPFADATFDRTLAQLVVQFMDDPLAGVAEMSRVTRPNGAVAACVWDHGNGTGPLSPFWDAVDTVDPDAGGELSQPGVREGDLARVFRSAGLGEITEGRLTVAVDYPSFADWWEPYTLGVGPAGDYLSNLTETDRERVQLACADRLGPGPFTITASAWAVRATPA